MHEFLTLQKWNHLVRCTSLSFDLSVLNHYASCLWEISERQIYHLMYSSEILLRTVHTKRAERSRNEWGWLRSVNDDVLGATVSQCHCGWMLMISVLEGRTAHGCFMLSLVKGKQMTNLFYQEMILPLLSAHDPYLPTDAKQAAETFLSFCIENTALCNDP